MCPFVGLTDSLQLCHLQGDDEGMSLNYLVYVLCVILWIAAIIDCAKSNNPNKIVWIIVILLVPFLGSILYYLFGRSR